LSWRIIRTVVAKELRETLRDRRTLFIMIVIPVLLYPGMLIAVEQIAAFGQRSLEASAPRVAVVGEGAGGREFLESGGALQVMRFDTVPLGLLETGRVAAIVVFPAEEWDTEATNAVRVVFNGTDDYSQYARGIAHRQIAAFGDELLVRRLERQGLPPAYAAPLRVEDSSIATAKQMGGYALGRFLPLLLILMTVLGAFYPSIDMAAGEKERGTLETLLTAPVPADQIVTGKFVAAGLMGFIAASLNLASMLLTFQSGILSFGGAFDLQFSIPLHAILVILGVLMLLSILFSALFLGIAVRSHSFKEAQNSLTPVYVLSFMPAMLAMMPGLEFTTTMALVPVGGVAFLFRDLMGGSLQLEPAIVAVAATVIYAMVALIFAARAFGREDVLFGGPGGDVDVRPLRARLLAWRRREPGIPRATEVMLLVTFVALLYFYLGRALMVRLGETGIPLAQLLLIALPVLVFIAVGRHDPRRSLALRAAPPRAYGAAVLIVLGAIPIGWTIAWLQSFVISLPVEYLQALGELVTATDARRLLWLFLIVALVPAVCEELLFRGALMQGLARSDSMPRAVLLSALVFGAFHLSFETAIRFLPTFFLGAVLGYVVWHTRSLFTGMLMHLVNNAAVVALVSSPMLRERFSDPSGQPPWVLVAAAPLVLWAGLRLLPRRPPPVVPADARAPELEMAR
jgi:sodium transport system permease protein